MQENGLPETHEFDADAIAGRINEILEHEAFTQSATTMGHRADTYAESNYRVLAREYDNLVEDERGKMQLRSEAIDALNLVGELIELAERLEALQEHPALDDEEAWRVREEYEIADVKENLGDEYGWGHVSGEPDEPDVPKEFIRRVHWILAGDDLITHEPEGQTYIKQSDWDRVITELIDLDHAEAIGMNHMHTISEHYRNGLEPIAELKGA